MWSLARAVLAPVARWWSCFALLHLLERLALVGTTFFFVRGGSGTASLVLATLLTASAAARGFARGTLRVRVERDLHARAVSALFRGDLLRASPLDADESEAAILEGVHHGARYLGELVPQMLADGIAAATLAAFLVSLAPRTFFVAAVALPFCAGGALLARRLTAREGERALDSYRPVVDGVVAAIHARLELVANGRDEAFQKEFGDVLWGWSRQAARAQRVASIAGRMPLVVGAVVLGAALFSNSGWRDTRGANGLGDVAIFASVLPPFAGLVSAFIEMTKTRLHFRSMALLLAGAELPRAQAPVPSAEVPCDVAWHGVSFTYPGVTDQALTDLELVWPAGRILVLAGPNGSGKSTALRLLLGITSAYGGMIRVGRGDLLALDLGAWRRSIGYLPQRPYLGDRMTIGEAMAFIAQKASPPDLRAALERVALWNVLASKAPSSPLSVKVGMLSAGERQRLALARVLASDSPILILDEPDANLDAAGTQLLARLVRELSKTKMIAIAAHTPELLALGGEGIHVLLERGRIVRAPGAVTPLPRAGTAG